jgi:putative flippase GtrA
MKFSGVGLLGVAVQLSVLQVFVKLGLHYMLATGLAVELALLHNYAWHRKWTWSSEPYAPYRWLRFHIANGLISFISNLLWMRLLGGHFEIPPLNANLIAITATAVLNFVLADRWVFGAAKLVDNEPKSVSYQVARPMIVQISSVGFRQ